MLNPPLTLSKSAPHFDQGKFSPLACTIMDAASPRVSGSFGQNLSSGELWHAVSSPASYATFTHLAYQVVSGTSLKVCTEGCGGSYVAPFIILR